MAVLAMRDFTPFINRLKKNARHLAKWAKRQNIECYRLYDRDLPEFPVAIDRYGHRLHISEYETGWVMTDEEHQVWLDTLCQTVATLFEMSPESIAMKTRRRQKGLQQYEKTGENGERFVVREGDLKFQVNLDSYLDTGLFLDHRPTRARVRSEAAGKRFLNLFAYTGSFTVYAAAGGARESITVDLSNTYLEWARRNLDLNGFDSEAHTRVRADVLNWLMTAVEQGERFDLIVMDPPSFSNSKKMDGVLDVQRDHEWMVDQCMKLLNRRGVLYFSTNLRGFKLEPMLTERFEVEDISHQSVPEDFRNRKIHQCFRIQHPAV